MILAGFLFCAFALFARNRKWSDPSGTHWGKVVIANLAAAVYWIGKQFQKTRNGR
jgi:hypothetical protein